MDMYAFDCPECDESNILAAVQVSGIVNSDRHLIGCAECGATIDVRSVEFEPVAAFPMEGF